MKGAAPINIRILDKEYVVSCSTEEHEDLIASARILDERMRHARDVAKIYGAERIAVMSALNIVHEFLQALRAQENKSASTTQSITRVIERIDSALGENQPFPIESEKSSDP
uniref:Cell division protein ZapA n=1 Tax=Candidatus Kentrum sp. SD TaxID=2126332 RepID=A0A451BKD5_9GAMM|nr:MAG: cell division protein ZapA [Candidatus Kentron sp. SD]